MIDNNKNEKSLVSPLNKLTKRIWFVSFAVGTAGIMLRYKYPFKEMFWVISISTLILAFACVVIILKKDFKFAERLIYLIATIALLIHSPEWLDIPAYLKNDYKVAEGVPTDFELRSGRNNPERWEVVVDDIKFFMPNDIQENSSDNWFVINYLPRSKYIVDYKVLSEQETKEKINYSN
ncbi:hypothetical protein AM499_06650 [Bacillus sp. FJAT-22090]|uniref:hypothetical protein n=1 Tax=Bacillus sp. FJAT-22090 TaxID=1581038 RepID=UPI0006AF8C34|nr:hypothetical protein [Bacillus sp. FJAT-22090]ALC85532.1 hypothetical protein AM499_06650 [Bacillus sp. FJAT-22090]